jgi:hypothetical protein
MEHMQRLTPGVLIMNIPWLVQKHGQKLRAERRRSYVSATFERGNAIETQGIYILYIYTQIHTHTHRYLNTYIHLRVVTKRDKKPKPARYAATAGMYYSLQYLLSVLTTYTCACIAPRVPQSLDEKTGIIAGSAKKKREESIIHSIGRLTDYSSIRRLPRTRGRRTNACPRCRLTKGTAAEKERERKRKRKESKSEKNVAASMPA